MTDERFRELINLYLDKEISSSEMELLQSEISTGEARRREFDTACRLHHAMSCALSSEVAANEARSPLPRTRWFVGFGMAASFILGGIFLAHAVSDELVPCADRRQTEASAAALAAEAKQRALQRFITSQRAVTSDEPFRSLASQFRLLGLQPALVPANHQLEEVEMRVRRVHVEWSEKEQRWQFFTVSDYYPSERMRDFNNLVVDSPFQLDSNAPSFILTGSEFIGYSTR